MAYRPLAETCNNGPCPTIYVDDLTGDVIVQGYATDERPRRLPSGEGVLHIPAAAWRTLVAQLPRA